MSSAQSGDEVRAHPEDRPAPATDLDVGVMVVVDVVADVVADGVEVAAAPVLPRQLTQTATPNGVSGPLRCP